MISIAIPDLRRFQKGGLSSCICFVGFLFAGLVLNLPLFAGYAHYGASPVPLSGGEQNVIIDFDALPGGSNTGNVYVGEDFTTPGSWSSQVSSFVFRSQDGKLTITSGGKGNNDTHKLYKPEWHAAPIEMKKQNGSVFKLMSFYATCEDWNSTDMNLVVKGYTAVGAVAFEENFSFNTLTKCNLVHNDVEVVRVEFGVTNYSAVGHAALDSISLFTDLTAVIVEDVAIDRASATLALDGKFSMLARVVPGNADNQAITYSTSNDAVAVVSESGIVTAVGYGSAVITATSADGGHSAPCTITVSESATGLSDPNATSETLALWTFLTDIYGQKVITGYELADGNSMSDMQSCSGKDAALIGTDMQGWQDVRTSTYAVNVRTDYINSLKSQYENGGICQVQYHMYKGVINYNTNGNYSNPTGDFSATQLNLTADEWNRLINDPGSEEQQSFLADIDFYCTHFLKLLIDGNGNPIPVIFRPLHEIDGGWFWWTSTESNAGDPLNYSARLYQMVYNRVVNVNGCHNLIWAWNPAMVGTSIQAVSSFYPGHQYCDIVGTDIYQVRFQTDGVKPDYPVNSGKIYESLYGFLQTIGEGKMCALMECGGLPNPEPTSGNDPNFPRWLYAMSWFNDADGLGIGMNLPGHTNSCSWIDSTLNHNIYLSLDELAEAGYVPGQASSSDDLTGCGQPLTPLIKPNPAQNHTSVIVVVDQNAELRMMLYDMTGRIVLQQVQEAGVGENTIPVNLQGLRSGVYQMVVQTGGKSATAKLLVK
jgi:mannan endo-1,4-beta-mannosidase